MVYGSIIAMSLEDEGGADVLMVWYRVGTWKVRLLPQLINWSVHSQAVLLNVLTRKEPSDAATALFGGVRGLGRKGGIFRISTVT